MELGKQWSCTSEYEINAIRTDFERILQEAGHRQTDLQAVRLPFLRRHGRGQATLMVDHARHAYP